MSWNTVTLIDCTDKITKGTTPTSIGGQFVSEGINFIKVESINEDGQYIPEKFAYIDERSNDLLKRSIIFEDDILISIAGAIGRTAYVNPTILPANTNQALAIIRPNKNIVYPKFLYYNFRTPSYQGQIKGSIVQAAQANVSLGVLNNTKIYLPSLPTQRKIASILSAYDNLIENNLKRIKLLEEKAFWRYKSEFDFFKPSNEVNKIPEGWTVKRADEIFKINIGKTPPREQSEWFNDEDSKVKWVSIKDINNSTVFAFVTSETVTEMAVSKFNMNVAKAHTVLLSFKLTVGKVAITTEDMTTNEAIAHFNIEDESQMCSEYIYFYLKNFPYDSLGSTSSIGTAINSKVVKAMAVLLPPKKVINDYKKDVENDFNLIQNLLKQNTKLREARDILLPKLMNGQIEV